MTDEQMQQLLDKVVRLATEDGYPPELTNKNNLLDARTMKMTTTEETFIRHFIEAYSSKAGIICVMEHALDVWMRRYEVLENSTTYHYAVVTVPTQQGYALRPIYQSNKDGHGFDALGLLKDQPPGSIVTFHTDLTAERFFAAMDILKG